MTAKDKMMAELEAAERAATEMMNRLGAARIWASYFGMVQPIDRLQVKYDDLIDKFEALIMVARAKADARSTRPRRRSE